MRFSVRPKLGFFRQYGIGRPVCHSTHRVDGRLGGLPGAAVFTTEMGEKRMNILKSALLGATCIVGVLGTAHAADVYNGGGGSLKDGPAYMPPIMWTGLYMGVSAGATFSDDITITSVADHPAANFDGDNGFLGGGHVGYNWQTPGNVVLGVELDIAASGADGVDYLSSLRGRAGLAMGRSLIYVTGGIASLSWDLEGNVDDSYASGGWVIGAGYERKLTPSLSFGVEGLYYSINDDDILVTYENDPGEVYDGEIDRDMWAVRARLNYHFGYRGASLK